SVEIPAPLGDRPSWGKVGIVAAGGFLLGIAWPHLTNTRIAPHPPGEGGSNATAVSASSAVAAPATEAANVAKGGAGPSTLTSAAPVASAAPSKEGRIAVGHGTILHCRDEGQDAAAEECDPLEFDPVAVPRIKALAQCPGTAGATGKLSIGFDVDFRRKE